MRYGIKQFIIIGIFGLFFLSIPFASLAENNEEDIILPISNGRTLYVGGSGLGNYSKIQDAINNGNNNDTVFVYDDSSPYYENILINKSIFLIGENKTSTIIDGQGTGGYIIAIIADRVLFSGFSVLNWGLDIYSPTGMYIHGDRCQIIGNIFSCINWRGYNAVFLNHSTNVSISGNSISHTDIDIVLESSSRNVISKNFFMDGFGAGILLRFSNNNKIFENIIVNNTYGVDIGYSTNNNISLNEISYNTYGMIIAHSLKNVITKNNFRQNIVYDAYNYFSFKPFWRNTWNANYWNRAKLLPKIIFGYLESYNNFLIIIPWINVDWHPAQKPYNISILN